MKRLIFVCSILLLININSTAQYNRQNYKETTHLVILDSTLAKNSYLITKSADFPGGLQKFFKFVYERLKYPRDARKQKIEGKVNVAFVIDSTGIVNKASVRVVQSLSPSCDAEAVRVIKASPKWTPAFSSQLNKNVNQWMMIPLHFKLR